MTNVDTTPMTALLRAATTASEHLIMRTGDELVVLPLKCPPVPGEQDDDDVRAVAAIDILRHLVEVYEAEQDDDGEPER